MKALFIDGEYFYYPENVKNFEELEVFLQEHYNSFVKFKKLSEDRTVPPFFIDEDSKIAYVNIQRINTVEEAEVSVMTKEDYKTSLNNAIDEVCSGCDNYLRGTKSCECGEIQNNLCLNGICELFTIAQDDFQWYNNGDVELILADLSVRIYVDQAEQ